MTEQKSMIARFDDENIVKVSNSPEDERIFITFLKDGKEQYASVDYEGLYFMPSMNLHIENNTASSVTISGTYEYDQVSVLSRTITIPANGYVDIAALYGIDTKITGNYGVAVGGIPNSATVNLSDMENCKQLGGYRVIFIIDDPTKDSFATITLT